MSSKYIPLRTMVVRQEILLQFLFKFYEQNISGPGTGLANCGKICSFC